MNLSSDKLALILEANRVISSTLEIKELLRQVMKMATEVVEAETSSILLYDASTSELYFDIALGEQENELKTIRLKPGEGIAGWVAENKKTQVINDVSSDPRWARRTDVKISFRTRSMIASPLLYKGALLGVIEAINKKNGIFTDEDAGVLEAFAAQAAVAIENARIFESLEEAKEKVEAVFSQMSDGAVFADSRGLRLLANESAAKLLGKEKTSAGTLFEVFEGFECKPGLREILELNPKSLPFEFLRKTPKTLYLCGTASRILNTKGGLIGILFIFSDATEERKESLVKKNFLSLVSHKLKTPLVSIVGYGPLLLDDPGLPEFHKKAIFSITRQGNYLLNLVEKLLNFTIMEEETMELQKFQRSFDAVVSGAVSSLKVFASERGAAVTVKDGIQGLPAVSMDVNKIEAAVKNLIENAVKFNDKKDKAAVEIGPARDGAFCGLYVKDNGPGIPPEEREKIFDKFYQIEESFTGQVEGAGLGLALVKRVAAAHGGRVTLESAVGAGSTFTILLPEKQP